jgi:hypothetical protein
MAGNRAAGRSSQAAAGTIQQVVFVNVAEWGVADSWALLEAFHRPGLIPPHQATTHQATTALAPMALPAAPSLAAWIAHGLSRPGSPLPEHLVLTTELGSASDPTMLWQGGQLLSKSHGIRLRQRGDAVTGLCDRSPVAEPPSSVAFPPLTTIRRQAFAALGDPEHAIPLARQRETFEMQAAIRDAVDVGEESPATRLRYGDRRQAHRFATQCLQARRLLQRGVPVVQLFTERYRSDCQAGTFSASSNAAGVPSDRQVTQALAALHTDLRRHAMLEQTLLVICGDEVRRIAPPNDSIVVVDDRAEVASQRETLCAAVGQTLPPGNIA